MILKNVLYVDDTISRYMRTELEKIKIDILSKIFEIKCDYMTYDPNISDILQVLIDKIEKNKYLCIFIDSKLYMDSSSDRTNGIWVSYILRCKFPFLNIYIISSQNNKENSMSNTKFPFLDKITKDSPKLLKDKYLEELKKCISDEMKMKEAINDFQTQTKNVTYEIEDNMKILIDKINNNKYDDFVSNVEFKKIISLLEKVIDNE